MKRFFKYASKSDLIFLLVWSVIGIVSIIKNDIQVFNISMIWFVLILFYIDKSIFQKEQREFNEEVLKLIDLKSCHEEEVIKIITILTKNIKNQRADIVKEVIEEIKREERYKNGIYKKDCK